MITKTKIENCFTMTARQKKLYKSMSIKEQDMFDYLVHVEDRKPADVFFFLLTLWNSFVFLFYYTIYTFRYKAWSVMAIYNNTD